MGHDVCALVRRDHDDLDRAFAAMIDPATPPRELTDLAEIARLAMAVHGAAEARVLDLVISHGEGGRTLALVAAHTRHEHVALRAATDVLARLRPASIRWYEHAIELRVEILEHAARADQLRWTLLDHVSPALHRTLASEYATERLRLLASSSPFVVANERDHALPRP